jgi:hypothetical protein
MSEHSAGISWQQQPDAAEAGWVAAAVAPHGRSREPAAAAAGLAEAAAAPASPSAAQASPSAAQALLPAAPAAAAVLPPGVVAQPGEFAASARRAEWALRSPPQVWVAVEEPRSAFVLFPERPALLRGREPSRQLLADPPAALARSFPTLLSHLQLRQDLGPPLPGKSSRAGTSFSHWDSSRREREPSPRPLAPEVPLSCRGLAASCPSTAHWGTRLSATASSTNPSDLWVRRAYRTWLPGSLRRSAASAVCPAGSAWPCAPPGSAAPPQRRPGSHLPAPPRPSRLAIPAPQCWVDWEPPGLLGPAEAAG